MSRTPVTDKVVNKLRSLCKSAGFDVPSGRQIQIAKAAELIEGAKRRILAREFKKLAFYRKKIRDAKNKNKASKNENH